jgi:hypothetical protein
MCTAILNEEFHGVELSFNSKPSTDILSMLKEAGFRWHNFKKIWYAKQNPKTLAIAEKLSDDNSIKNETQTTQEIKTKPKTIEEYYPPYDKVGLTPIYKTSDIEILNNHGGYFFDEKAYIHSYTDSYVMYDLTNALQTGKTCTRYSITKKVWNNHEPISLDVYNKNKIRTFKELIQAVKADKELVDIKVQKSEKKGIETFSPFVQIKPIKRPKKWTKAHVWKAILSGQIYKGEQNYYYTDDYAYDAAYNYKQGCSVDLIKLADELISSRSDGIRIYENDKSIDDGIVSLSVCNYSFDGKTLYFDESCNHAEKERRNKAEAEQKQAHNDSMKAKVLDIKPSDIIPNSIYKITYLETDCNTGIINEKQKFQYSNCLFYDGDEDEPIECRFDITELEYFEPDNHTLYTISDFYNRPYGDKYDDKRIINMGNWENVVTGYALKELLNEGKIFATIRKSNYTIESAKTECMNHIDGTKMWMFGVCNTDYKQSLFKLNAEELRIKDDDKCLLA